LSSIQFFLVDFENIKISGLPALQNNQHVIIFTGASQKTIDLGLAIDSQKYAERVQWVQISGNGKNALDFHISFYLGMLLSKYPQSSFNVLSKDTGFDPLINHMNALGHKCKRITSFVIAETTIAANSKESFARIRNNLQKLDSRARPKKVTSLKSYFGSICKDTVFNADEIINRLVTENIIKVNNTKIEYIAQKIKGRITAK